MSEQATQERVRAERVGKIVHVRIHGDRGQLAGIVVNLSRTGALLTIRGEQWMVGTDDPDLSFVSLRVASHFGDGLKVEFREAGRTVPAQIVRFTEATVDGKRMVCLGCSFDSPLSSDVVAAILHEGRAPGGLPRGEPKVHTILQSAATPGPGTAATTTPGVGLPLASGTVAHGMHDLLTTMCERGASDLHVRGDSPVRLRVHGELVQLSTRAITPDEARRYLNEVLTPEERVRFDTEWDLDFGYSADGIGRFRVNALRARGEIGMAIRRIPLEVPTIEELGLAPACRRIAENRHGLVLVTGPTGSGKSTTLAAMIRHINEQRACHIVTMEDPVEFVHQELRAQVTQREVGRDVRTFSDALRRAMRQDPDVLLVGEMRDLETIALAVTAAETGHLVFGTLHTTSASTTVERIVDVFPSEQQTQIRMQLANSLQAICSQILVPKTNTGLVVAQEILIASRGVRALIRESKAPQLENMMQTGAREGMQTLEDSLNRLVQKNLIDRRTALARANNPSQIKRAK